MGNCFKKCNICLEYKLVNYKKCIRCTNGLVCNECKENKKFSDTATINEEIFPSTPSEPFWTSDKNKWSKNRYWTVNFFTGFSFNRFTEFKPLASRFVKDR